MKRVLLLFKQSHIQKETALDYLRLSSKIQPTKPFQSRRTQRKSLTKYFFFLLTKDFDISNKRKGKKLKLFNKFIKVSGYVFSKVDFTPLKNPRFISLSDAALGLIGLNKESVQNDQEALNFLSGNAVPSTAQVKYNK